MPLTRTGLEQMACDLICQVADDHLNGYIGKNATANACRRLAKIRSEVCDVAFKHQRADGPESDYWGLALRLHAECGRMIEPPHSYTSMPDMFGRHARRALHRQLGCEEGEE